MRRGLAAVLALAPLACSSADETTASACAEAPVVTYENFGRGFLTENCNTCHAATSADRHDAPQDVTFDTEEQAQKRADEILGQATGSTPAMPPGGGVSAEDRELLRLWLECYR